MKGKGATLIFGAWLCYIYVKIYIYQSEYVSMVRRVSTSEVTLYFGFLVAVVRTIYHFSYPHCSVRKDTVIVRGSLSK